MNDNAMFLPELAAHRSNWYGTRTVFKIRYIKRYIKIYHVNQLLAQLHDSDYCHWNFIVIMQLGSLNIDDSAV